VNGVIGSLCSNSCRPLYSADSHVEVGLLGTEYWRVGGIIQLCVSVLQKAGVRILLAASDLRSTWYNFPYI